jgi:DNA-binding response OmpR family regulator
MKSLLIFISLLEKYLLKKGILMKDSILIIGDDNKSIDSIESTLINTDFDVITSSSFHILNALIQEEEIKLIILEDKFLDHVFDVREAGYNLPIVLLYKDYNEDLIIKALNNGVDDYISYSCSNKLFLSKIKNLIKRYYKNFDVIKYKDITFNSNTNNFYIKNTLVELTKQEKELLLEFFKNSNKILSRDLLIETVWSEHFDISFTAVNVAVKRLKDRLNSYKSDTYIKAVRGQGYLFF